MYIQVHYLQRHNDVNMLLNENNRQKRKMQAR